MKETSSLRRISLSMMPLLSVWSEVLSELCALSFTGHDIFKTFSLPQHKVLSLFWRTHVTNRICTDWWAPSEAIRYRWSSRSWLQFFWDVRHIWGHYIGGWQNSVQNWHLQQNLSLCYLCLPFPAICSKFWNKYTIQDSLFCGMRVCLHGAHVFRLQLPCWKTPKYIDE